jgi:hypothetical protein
MRRYRPPSSQQSPARRQAWRSLRAWATSSEGGGAPRQSASQTRPRAQLAPVQFQYPSLPPIHPSSLPAYMELADCAPLARAPTDTRCSWCTVHVRHIQRSTHVHVHHALHASTGTTRTGPLTHAHSRAGGAAAHARRRAPPRWAAGVAGGVAAWAAEEPGGVSAGVSAGVAAGATSTSAGKGLRTDAACHAKRDGARVLG